MTIRCRLIHYIVIGLSASTLGLLCIAGCTRKAVTSSPPVAAAPEFAGSAPCAGCHAKEFDAQHASRHALTFRQASGSALGRLAPPAGPVDRSSYTLLSVDNRFVLRGVGANPSKQPLDFVLGSGKTGMTYVAVVEQSSLLEASRSFFPRWRRWETTPGQEKGQAGDTSFGHVHGREASRKCLGCHSVVLPADGLAPSPSLYGVGCESCHGPGRDHIAAMRAGSRSDLHMERLAGWGATRLNEMCGKCHRTEHDLNLSSPDARQTQRFQPYALVRSACRTESGDVLSCLTCHNPHTDASPDRRSYEAACLNCHGPSADRSPDAVRVCPVNPKNGCIGCHMPARNPFPHTKVPASIVDHRISVPSR
jgi:hypothetical protein